MVYEEKMDLRIKVFRHGHGPVYTAGIIPTQSISMDEFGRITNEDGSFAPIIHQWDDHEHIFEKSLEYWNVSRVSRQDDGT